MWTLEGLDLRDYMQCDAAMWLVERLTEGLAVFLFKRIACVGVCDLRLHATVKSFPQQKDYKLPQIYNSHV